MAAALRRRMLPRLAVTAFYFLRDRAQVSPRADVTVDARLWLGRKSRIASFVTLRALYGSVRIGTRTDIGTGCVIEGCGGGLEIGDDCLISPNVVITGSGHSAPGSDSSAQYRTARATTIGNNVWVGVGTVILEGATIGDGAIIAPNSVVEDHIPAYGIARGDPAATIFVRR
jgi:carbonic anhydrase/acetyltransferase-like protein (isoleucine patch superfamily)